MCVFCVMTMMHFSFALSIHCQHAGTHNSRLALEAVFFHKKTTQENISLRHISVTLVRGLNFIQGYQLKTLMFALKMSKGGYTTTDRQKEIVALGILSLNNMANQYGHDKFEDINHMDMQKLRSHIIYISILHIILFIIYLYIYYQPSPPVRDFSHHHLTFSPK